MIDELYAGVTREEIDKCLNCDKPECTNCLAYNDGESLREGRIVEQLTSDGELVARFKNGREAEKITKLSYSAITNSINQHGSVLNFVWRYAPDQSDKEFFIKCDFCEKSKCENCVGWKERKKITYKRTLLQIDLDGNIVAEYLGINDAARKLNSRNAASICRAAKRGNIYRNHYWRYKETSENV